MIRIGDNEYPLCLLDTNAVSEMTKRPDREFHHFVEWSFHSNATVIPCFSLFTILELRRRPELYQAFLALFGQYPCAILRSYEQLLEDEARAYPDPTRLNPILVGFGGSAAAPDKTSLGSALDGYLKTPQGHEDERRWVSAAPSIIAGMTELVTNYPPASSAYKPGEIRQFVEWAGFSQLVMRAKPFVEEMLARDEVVEIDAFPSIKMTAFTVFYKFYVDKLRRPSTSDAFDVIISAPLPYVDAVITERHQCEVIHKTRQQDSFIAKVQALSLADFREAAPS